MLNTDKISFRCTTNPNGPLVVPQYMFDVDGMRTHPEYEELDADGNVVARREEQAPKIKFVPVAVAPAKKGKK